MTHVIGNNFNMRITQQVRQVHHSTILSVEVKVDEENHVVIMLSSLPKSNKSIKTTLLVGKSRLTIDEVCILLCLRHITSINQEVSQSQKVLWWNSKAWSRHGRSKTHEKNFGLNCDHSKLRPKDVECHYCHKKGHVNKNQRPTKANVNVAC